ncbi:unnamed protein product [Amoebophrya sp. A120]|nr:unnamed protein product [Amoebophrya sp. A120]|eukprot:GSA120T00001523001.1
MVRVSAVVVFGAVLSLALLFFALFHSCRNHLLQPGDWDAVIYVLKNTNLPQPGDLNPGEKDILRGRKGIQASPAETASPVAVATPGYDDSSAAAAKDVSSLAGENTFTLENDEFHINGEKLNLYSGSFHYFRLPEVYWADRLQSMKDMGLNTIQFYVPWNLAELAGEGSHVRFIELASKLGFWLLLRPGPYVCGEWDFGGLPARLQKLPKIRTFSKPYLDEVKTFWNYLLPPLKKHLFVENQGGKILMVQVENEFGSYGHVQKSDEDKKYMDWALSEQQRHLGTKVQYYTTDNYLLLNAGGIHDATKHVYHVGDFGPTIWSPRISFMNMRHWNEAGKSPEFVSEYYTGWMTAWKDSNFATTDAKTMISTMKSLPNFNLYMAFGCTNFGFTNGLNLKSESWLKEKYLGQPQVTSYDYNAPIAEDGGHGIGSDNEDKFLAIKNEIASRKTPGAPVGTRTSSSSRSGSLLPSPTVYPDIVLQKESYSLLKAVDVSDGARCQALPPAVDADLFAHEHDVFDHVFLYRSTPSGCSKRSFKITNANDRVYVFVGGNLIRWVDREDSGAAEFHIEKKDCHAEIDFVVENYGRQNFSPQMLQDRKGFQISGFKAAAAGTLHLCKGLFDKISAQHEEFVAASIKTTTWSSGKQQQRATAQMAAFNTTKAQMRYIWPLMDRQNAAERATTSAAGSSIQESNNVVVQMSRKLEEQTEQVQQSEDEPERQRNEQEREQETTSSADTTARLPAIYSGFFSVPEPKDPATQLLADTFLDMRTLFSTNAPSPTGKGVVFVNGMHLGRYWNSAGPIYTLYLPGVMLKPGENAISVVEFETAAQDDPVRLKSSAKIIYK